MSSPILRRRGRIPLAESCNLSTPQETLPCLGGVSSMSGQSVDQASRLCKSPPGDTHPPTPAGGPPAGVCAHDRRLSHPQTRSTHHTTRPGTITSSHGPTHLPVPQPNIERISAREPLQPPNQRPTPKPRYRAHLISGEERILSIEPITRIERGPLRGPHSRCWVYRHRGQL